ncbi:hypothetical protein AB0K74_12830, partial [Streptomyces sp. NPDC056159]|uniref:hypothetical protein n=1 Tax=Streptomyces sp. NPDC056159 TaxID=3155537 RepID=UPI003421344A
LPVADHGASDSLTSTKDRRLFDACSGHGVSVLADETAEDPGAQQLVGAAVYRGGLFPGIGW